MASNNANNSKSSIVMASAAVDIPMPRETVAWIGANGSRAGASGGVHNGPIKGHRGGLPTPPHSISPSLPPQRSIRDHSPSIPPTPPPHGADSDIDLHDTVEQTAAPDQPTRGLTIALANGNPARLDTAGDITPALLATHHLPGILLNNGPLAIRHIMSHLTTSVPGFSIIPAPKSRRLVVSALESRSRAAVEATAGVHGDVIFEKVSWGCWDASLRGQPSRYPQQLKQRQPSPNATRRRGMPASHNSSLRSPSPYPSITAHANDARRVANRSRPRARATATYKALKRFDGLPQTDADRMSLDGPDGALSSDSSDDGLLGDAQGDATDSEDWASLGPATLRARALAYKRKAAERRARVKVRREEMERAAGGGSRNTCVGDQEDLVERREREEEKSVREKKEFSDTVLKLMPGIPAEDGEAIRALLQLGQV